MAVVGMHARVPREMIARVQRDFGRLDILVNNVGIQHVSPVHEASPIAVSVADNLVQLLHVQHAAPPRWTCSHMIVTHSPS